MCRGGNAIGVSDSLIYTLYGPVRRIILATLLAPVKDNEAEIQYHRELRWRYNRIFKRKVDEVAKDMDISAR